MGGPELAGVLDAVIVGCLADDRSCQPASAPVSRQVAVISRCETRTSTRRPTRRWSIDSSLVSIRMCGSAASRHPNNQPLQRLDQLPDPHTRQPRVLPRQVVDLLLEMDPALTPPAAADTEAAPSERSTRRTVLRSTPSQRASYLIPTPRTKCSRRNSAHRFTSRTPPSPTRSYEPSQVNRPGRLYRTLIRRASPTGRSGVSFFHWRRQVQRRRDPICQPTKPSHQGKHDAVASST